MCDGVGAGNNVARTIEQRCIQTLLRPASTGVIAVLADSFSGSATTTGEKNEKGPSYYLPFGIAQREELRRRAAMGDASSDESPMVTVDVSGVVTDDFEAGLRALDSF